MKYFHFPGCSLSSTGRGYYESLNAVCGELGMAVEEIHDWNCCGATAYMSVDEMKAFALAARNLALAEAQAGNGHGPDSVPVLAPCAACFLVLTKAQKYMEEFPDVGKRIRHGLNSVGLNYQGKAVVRHPLDVFVNDVGLPTIRDHAKRPLSGLRVACYYGCQIVRPYATFDDQYSPHTMDDLIGALGGVPVDWPIRTRCCGGSHTGTIPEVGLRLNQILLSEARRRGADAIATACPLCQFNLECFQDQISKNYAQNLSIPVLYFTQLMGVAFGIEGRKLGLQRNFQSLTLPASSREEIHV